MKIARCPFHFFCNQIRSASISKTHFSTKKIIPAAEGDGSDAATKEELNFKTFLKLINHGNTSSPYEKAINYLNAAAPTCNLQTVVSKNKTDTSNLFTSTSEVFTPGLVYDLVAELPGFKSKVTESLLDLFESHMNSDGLFTFFENKCINCDVDCTSVCLWALLHSKRLDSSSKLARCVAKAISMNTAPDTLFPDSGKVRQVIQTYFPPFNSVIFVGPSFGKLDPVAMSNSLRLLYFFQMSDLATDTQDCVHDWLLDDQKFNSGTRYYESPDSLLYFLSNCVPLSSQAHSKFHHILTKRLAERVGNTDRDSSLERAKRILTAYNLGLIEPTLVGFSSKIWTPNKLIELGAEREKLLGSQTSDGSWPLEAIFKLSTATARFYNRTASTAFAAKALHVSRNLVS